jgi:SOS-response transcriptional repressor LexA
MRRITLKRACGYDPGNGRSERDETLERRPLTDRQRAVLAFIRRTLVSTGSAPTQAEIARYFEMSQQGAHGHVLALRRKGYIRTTQTMATISLVEEVK